MKILNWFSGKKSYIVGILMIALGLLQGENHLIMEGLAVMTLRAGIKKAE